MSDLHLRDYSEIRAALGEHVFRFENRTILIPGGGGFLGRVFTAFFEYLNAYVFRFPVKLITVENYIVGQTPALVSTENVRCLSHDLTTPLYLKLERTPIDFIINTAGIASPAAYLRCPLEVLDVSYIGTRAVLELAVAKNARVLNFSSSECYGDPPADMIPTPETYMGQISSTSKRAPYDCGKKVLEALSHVFRTAYGVDVSIVLPFNVYGYMHANDYRVIPNFVYAAHQGKPLKVYAPGTQTRTFCFYTNFLAGALLVLLKGKDFAYNVGTSDGEISMCELAKTVEMVFEKHGLVTMIEPPSAYVQEPQRRCPDITKARGLGYEPKVSLVEGLERIKTWINR
jgi:UDP-glucuronate decarboxylase